uniref:DNA fragmentation factor, beta polypeptide (caspase-activated DNase) n=1 Tax=Acanthochromis polyacanthus TaxID=80966 RepID=A0A3Q1FEG6_9TELE
MFGLLGKNKPVKIRGYSENRKYGVAAKNVKELLKKSCKLFQVSVRTYELLLGFAFSTTRVFFNLFLILMPSTTKGILPEELNEHNKKCSVDARFKTKSAYMKFNCESRIRSYMKEVDDATKTIEKARVRTEFLKASKCLAEMLKAAKYNGCYFDRTEKEPHRLCTKDGWFTCQGPFDQAECQTLHSINPYSSRDSRIVFSTWNLDHRIEKKRTIIPTLLEALQNHKSTDINLKYFYQLLFSRKNLKLVHIVCHKKGHHDLLCDPKKIVINAILRC